MLCCPNLTIGDYFSNNWQSAVDVIILLLNIKLMISYVIMCKFGWEQKSWSKLEFYHFYSNFSSIANGRFIYI